MSLKLEDLENGYREIGAINIRQEKRVRSWESKIHQLATSYLFFQAILLLTISHTSSLKCHSWWIPFTLSLSAAIIYGISFVYTVIMYLGTDRQLDLNLLEREIVRKEMERARNSHPHLISKDRVQTLSVDRLKLDRIKWAKRYVFVGLSMTAMLVFTMVMLVACHSIPCDQLNRER